MNYRMYPFASICPFEIKLRDLRKKEAEIKFQLRRHGGHRGKVSQEMLIWLNDLERMEDEMDRLCISKSGKEMRLYACNFGRKLNRAEVKLVHQINSILENASSLLASYGSTAVDRMTEQLVSPTLVGKSAQSVLKLVCDYLTDPMIGIIGLYGEGGVGKTTIMKYVNNLLMKTEMFDKIIWFTLSQSATIDTLQNEIAVQLGIALPYGVITDPGQSSRASLISDNLKNMERCLLLLDNIWSDWDDIMGDKWGLHFLARIGILEQGTSSGYYHKVVFTTRSPRVCQNMGAHKQIHVSPLSKNEAWDLFVTRSGNQVVDPEIRHIAEEIVFECKGLPITVTTIAHAMREEVNSIAWIQALKDIRSTYDKRVSDLLSFGYSHLKNEQVQMCFLYCALFPEDFKFEARELIRYWIAEELVCEESIVASIDKGYQILREITNANMLEPVTNGGDIWVKGGDTWVRMHELFRDLAISIMTQKLGFFVQAGRRLTDLYDPLTNRKKASLIRNQIERLYFRHETSAISDLSTLLLRDTPLSYISDSFFDRLRNIQVLDMSYTGIEKLPNSIYHLSKLRVLFLQYCTSLEKLPSFEYWEELQFLNLRGTLMRELPHGMEKLIKLRCLDMSETIRLENIREGIISSLYNLEELQLQGSLLCKLASPTIVKCLKEIRCLEKLSILTLSAVGFEDHLDTILHLQGYNLTSFSINVYGSTQDYNEDV